MGPDEDSFHWSKNRWKGAFVNWVAEVYRVRSLR